MGLFLDSADIGEVKQAVGLGFISGVTTNPTIMAKVKGEPKDIIRQICAVSPGPVFYQVTAKTVAERECEGREFYAIGPDNLVLKIPATTENMGLIAKLAPDIPCAATAVYSAYQAYAACCAGAKYVIPYVNRATRLLGDGCKLVAEIAEAIGAQTRPVEILAASIKSPDEAAKAIAAGADHLTLPLEVLLAMGNHKLSDEATEEFNRAGSSG
jgi:transaldolase